MFGLRTGSAQSHNALHWNVEVNQMFLLLKKHFFLDFLSTGSEKKNSETQIIPFSNFHKFSCVAASGVHVLAESDTLFK